MSNVNWLRKLTSRKMWAAIASFVSMMIVATGGTEGEGAKIAALVMAGATVIGYVIGEGLTDAAHVGEVEEEYYEDEEDEEVE